MPRTRQRGFMPVILGILKSQEQEMGEPAGYLYSCGNTMEDISGVPFLTKMAYGRRIEYYFTYLKYDVSIRKYIYSTNWIERFNRQIKKSARYKCALPSVESALHLIGTIAFNTNYLQKKIGELSHGLRKINKK